MSTSPARPKREDFSHVLMYYLALTNWQEQEIKRLNALISENDKALKEGRPIYCGECGQEKGRILGSVLGSSGTRTGD